jgi:hypothetical protein
VGMDYLLFAAAPCTGSQHNGCTLGHATYTKGRSSPYVDFCAAYPVWAWAPAHYAVLDGNVAALIAGQDFRQYHCTALTRSRYMTGCGYIFWPPWILRVSVRTALGIACTSCLVLSCSWGMSTSFRLCCSVNSTITVLRSFLFSFLFPLSNMYCSPTQRP